METLTQNRLKEIIKYCPETGNIYRLLPVSNVKSGLVKAKPSKNGYLRMHIDGKLYYLHRLIWLYMNNEFPKCIDHIDGNRQNNIYANLRATTQKGNLQNLSEKTNAASGLRGAYYHPDVKKWQSKICVDGKTKSLGYFSTPNEAHEAYIKAKKIFHTFNSDLRK